ncbi:hypothetical protein BpHYR1_046754 [Brachionus plicatilis]|uniref:Uncharacterized protein n=1 Tax=Brachionus plicatilis TaxID=10195 RepID=A0A3M7QUN0_BRAPC|nr:hypothetical protein BpHYR1_046754 [Brachionus plicatilis]
MLNLDKINTINRFETVSNLSLFKLMMHDVGQNPIFFSTKRNTFIIGRTIIKNKKLSPLSEDCKLTGKSLFAKVYGSLG